MKSDRQLLEDNRWMFLKSTQVGGDKSSTFANLWCKPPGYGWMTQWPVVHS